MSDHNKTDENEELDLNLNLEEIKSKDFNARLLICAFHQSVCKSSELEDVSLKEYLIAYEEIIKFLECMGAIFYFVIVDIREKVVILDGYLKKNPANYATVLKLVEYEKKENLLTPAMAAKQPNSGARHILRLHRALIFVYKFLESLHSADQKCRTPELCTAAYEATLAKYHPWVVRKTVKFGMMALPRRETLVGYMCKTNEDFDKFPVFISKVLKVYEITQNIYDKHQILDLP